MKPKRLKDAATICRKVPASIHGSKLLLLIMFVSACAGGRLLLVDSEPSHTHNFNHKLHLEQARTDCMLCHYAVRTDGVEKFGMLPIMVDCLKCHMDKFNAKECHFCHLTETPGPLRVPAHEHLTFSHVLHAELKSWNRECLDCHARAREITKATQKSLPPMQLCLECHQPWYDNLECLNCHNGFEKVALKPLSEFSHTGNFTDVHGPTARNQVLLCAQCHQKEFCVDCHRDEKLGLPPDLMYPDNTSMHWAHEGDFITRHFIEARFSSGQCVRCHNQRFCRDCHIREGIADVIPGSRMDLTADPHPLGFGFREDPTSPNFHGRIARREIFTCAGCHDNGADTICLECHATIEKGGRGINPHPRGFRSRLDRNRDRVCLMCHVK